MAKIIINAEGAIFGRLCSYAAKQALEGSDIIVVNSEKAVISGNKKDIVVKYQRLRAKGGFSQKGPKYSRLCEKMLKRGIRGMLPDHRNGIGRQAFLRIRCYEGIPKEFEGKEIIKLKLNKPKKYIELKELSEKL